MGSNPFEMNKKLVILLAEDDPKDLALLNYAIVKNGQEVDIKRVQDGEEAIQYMEGGGQFSNRRAYPFPDLIIVDLKMPRLTGLDVLEWRRHHPECAAVPLIMFSGSGLQEDVDAAYKLGATSYFSKPSSFEKLQDVVQTILHYWANAELPQVQMARHN